MATLHFTDVVISRLKEPGIYYDVTTPGFGVRVGKNRKVWVVVRGKQRQRIKIGRYPSMTLADARKEAKRLLLEKPKKNDRMTFDDAYELYKPDMERLKPRTQRDYKRMLEKFLQPELGKKRLTDIAYEDITAIADKTAEKRNCLAVVRTFFRWCVRPPRRYVPHSPLEGVQVGAGKRRKRVLVPEEIRLVWKAAAAQGYPHGTVAQLLLLTGQRRGEIANLRRPWINEKEQTITLPDWVCKNKKEHTFPYNGMVAKVLEQVPRFNSTDLLFPSRVSDERPLSGWSKYKKEMNDGVEGWTLHDLRRTFRTIHGKIGTPREIGERLINHAAAVMTDVEIIYDLYKYLPQMRVAVENYERHLEALLSPPSCGVFP
jgi:integrase